MRLLKQVAEGERLPHWYSGVCWFDGARCTFIVAPIPLNVVLRWLRRSWWWLRTHYDEHSFDRCLAEAHAAGYERGFNAAKELYRRWTTTTGG